MTSSGSSQLLRDLAVDVLNTAKSGKDTKAKVFQLEQFREIILHRDTSLIEEFIGDVFDFTTEKSSIFRKFLLRFSAELFDVNINLTLPHLIDMYSFYLSEANDSVVAAMCREISKLYAKLALAIYHFPDQQESRRLWPAFRAICNKLTEYVASARSDSIKVFGLQLMEAMMFFGISTVSTTTDPRLQRKINDPRLRRAAGANASAADASAASNPSASGTGGAGASGAGSASSTSNTADAIAAHHPFIAKNILQGEADELFSKLCIWATTNGPPSFPFSPRLMSLLGQTLAAVGIFRSHLGVQAAKAVLAIFLSEATIARMTVLEKEQLARASTRLQRAITVYGNNSDPDTDETIAKLKNEINRLALNEVAANEVTGNDAVTGKKRDYTEFIDEEDNELTSEEHKASVKTALLTLETNKRQLVERSQAQLDNNMFNVNAAGTAATGYSVDTRSLPPVPTAEFTELSAELVSLQNLSYTSATKLVSIDITTQSENASYITPLMNFDGREYADLAQFNLLRVMDNFLLVKDMKPTKTWRVCQELLLRAVLSLSMSSVQAGTTPFLVTLVHTFSNLINSGSNTGNTSNASNSSSLLVHSQQVPSAVFLPRAIWLFVSFAFQVSQPIFPRGHMTVETTTTEQEDKSKQITLTLLTQFCQRFYSCIVSLEEESNNGANPEVSSILIHHYRTIYDNMILVILSRFLQIAGFRGYVKDWMFQLPHIPLAAMHLAILVSQTGSKNPVVVHGTMGHNMGAHSQRYDALSLLGGFVFAQDEVLSQKTLQYLLWQTLSDDFKMRHKIIDLIINEIYGQNPEVDAIITGFALQSLTFLLNPAYLRESYSSPFKVSMDNQIENTPDGEEEMNVDEMNEEEYEAYLAQKEGKNHANSKTRSLYEVIDSFNEENENTTVDSKLFAQYFHSITDEDQHMAHADPAKQQENFTKAFHLLERLTVVDVNMLVIFEEVFLLASHNPELCSIVALPSETLDSTPIGETDGNGEVVTAEADTTVPNSSNKESWNIGVLVRAKLKVVLADLLSRSTSTNHNQVHNAHNKKFSAAELFHILAQIRGRFSLPVIPEQEEGTKQVEWQRDELTLLVYALQCLLPQLDQPPKVDLIVQVLSYLQLPYSQKETKQIVPEEEEKINEAHMDVDEESDEKENASAENVQLDEANSDKLSNEKASSQDTSLPTISEMEEMFFNEWLSSMDDDRFVVFTQLLPAFSAKAIFACLPRIIRVYTSAEFLLTRSLFAVPVSSSSTAGAANASSSDAAFAALKTLIQRFIKPIPPPVSRAQLLLHLLRIDNEAENIDRKAYLAVIDLCLANKGDFHAKVIKDCMEMIVFPPELSETAETTKDTDETQRAALLIPPFAIMRMAILSAKNYPELIGSYVLHTMIPTFISRQVWVTAPKVWEGVVMASKILAVSGSIHAEATLKALLGMPVSQLMGVIKVAPNLLPAMKKLLVSLGEEKEKLLKAFQQYPPLPTGTQSQSQSQPADLSKAEKDKEKLFKDIVEGRIGSGTAAAAKK